MRHSSGCWLGSVLFGTGILIAVAVTMFLVLAPQQNPEPTMTISELKQAVSRGEVTRISYKSEASTIMRVTLKNGTVHTVRRVPNSNILQEMLDQGLSIANAPPIVVEESSSGGTVISGWWLLLLLIAAVISVVFSRAGFFLMGYLVGRSGSQRR